MTRFTHTIVVAHAVLLLGSAAASADQNTVGSISSPHITASQDAGADRADARAFFQSLVDRYRRLVAYEDVADVVQITTRPGEEPQRVETRIAATIQDNKLRVETPGSQVRDGIGLDVPLNTSPAMDAFVQKYNLWIAPHMALRFTDEPLQDFRLGVDEGFTPTKIETVTIDNNSMVHLQLTSGDGLSEDYTARFDLYVNPESMLIERIEGEQRLPDGADYRTTLDITPIRADESQVIPSDDADIDQESADKMSHVPPGRSLRSFSQ
ncbi:MAG: hypothetical protein IIB99_10690 [Planctomycetes bacterium]|nr:hypothetical protein [Planctomycetota bacterium]